MATVSRTIGAFNDGAQTVAFSYDDVSLLIQSVTLINTGAVGTLHCTISQGGIPKFTGSRAVGAVTLVQDLTALNLLMVAGTDKFGGAALNPPFDFSLAWSVI